MKSEAEILQQRYLNKRDIQVLLQVSRRTADKYFKIARQMDEDELQDRVIEENRARTSSVLKVSGMDYDLLMKQIKGTAV